MNYSLIPAGQVPSLSYREDVSLRSTRALRQSLFGREAAWVHAAGDRATLVHGRREALRLEEVPVDRRAPILKAYPQIAPGARGHVPVDWMWIGEGCADRSLSTDRPKPPGLSPHRGRRSLNEKDSFGKKRIIFFSSYRLLRPLLPPIEAASQGNLSPLGEISHRPGHHRSIKLLALGLDIFDYTIEYSICYKSENSQASDLTT